MLFNVISNTLILKQKSALFGSFYLAFLYHNNYGQGFCLTLGIQGGLETWSVARGLLNHSSQIVLLVTLVISHYLYS